MNQPLNRLLATLSKPLTEQQAKAVKTWLNEPKKKTRP